MEQSINLESMDDISNDSNSSTCPISTDTTSMTDTDSESMNWSPNFCAFTGNLLTSESAYARRDRKRRRQRWYADTYDFQNYIKDMVQIISTTRMKHGRGTASLSRNTRLLANSVIQEHIFRDIAKDARQLMIAAKRRTLMAWDVECAVMLQFTGERAARAVAEGQKAVRMYEERLRRKGCKK